MTSSSILVPPALFWGASKHGFLFNLYCVKTLITIMNILLLIFCLSLQVFFIIATILSLLLLLLFGKCGASGISAFECRKAAGNLARFHPLSS